jgi:hypothetical protein
MAASSKRREARPAVLSVPSKLREKTCGAEHMITKGMVDLEIT